MTDETDPRGPALWRSLEEYRGGADLAPFLDAEFPAPADPSAVDRRSLLKLMAASWALAGLAGCDTAGTPAGAPLLSRPSNVPGHDPGRPLVFASSLPFRGHGVGVLVRTHEGRAVKIEGNPLHPASLGAAGPLQQAAVLGLHDPDRSREARLDGAPVRMERAERALRDLRRRAEAAGGRGLHIVLPVLASPTMARVLEEVRAVLPEVGVHHVSALPGGASRAAAGAAFGRPLDGVPDFSAADAVLTIGGDPFAEAPGHLRHARDWIERRRDRDRPAPVLIACESRFSLAGTRADRRHALTPAGCEAFLRAVLAELDDAPAAGDAPAGAGDAAGLLRAAGERALVLAGEEQPQAVHGLALAIMQRLGALGRTWRALPPAAPEPTPLSRLAADLASGAVSQLLVLGCNPVYGAPAELDLAALVGRVPESVHLGTHHDETGRVCRLHLPQAHPLESWGDLTAFDGTVGLVQPATVPRWAVFTPSEVLTRLIAEPVDARAITQAVWRERWGGDFEARWDAALEDGVVPESAPDPVPLGSAPRIEPPAPLASPPAALTAVFAPDPHLQDGAEANNGWLQELPKPVTKEVWGHAALIGPRTAERLTLASGDTMTLSREGREIVIPVLVAPGHAEDCVTLALGHGRTAAGRIGDGIGIDVSPLRPRDGAWSASLDGAAAAGARRPPVLTQHHHAMEGRAIVRVVAPGESLPPAADPPSIYPDWPQGRQQWAMAIDLDACIGCNACVVACQAENNVPVVGPEEVAKGREMHWLRIDRYFGGTPEAPDVYFQPVPCMQCEKAPCEIVCPVNATVHSTEGLNDMVYNRCIGTRTCSNNCPYKVRRFNFVDYRNTPVAPPASSSNPEVTLRDRGVMEKCTYCVQRISAARIEAEIAGRRVADGEVVTACQQACPTRAITFGDKADPDSAVAAARADGRSYALLGELGTRPRTTYLARIATPAARREG